MGASIVVDFKRDYGRAEPVARPETAELLRGTERGDVSSGPTAVIGLTIGTE
jgi:hypothetical protein